LYAFSEPLGVARPFTGSHDLRWPDAMDIETLEIRSLGNATHLIASADGEAIVIDPPRDAWRLAELASARGWRLTHAVETHVHNDYLSGSLELRASDGVEILAPARGRYAFEHRPVDDGDVLDVGDIRLRARATPGHTPEHLAWDIRHVDASDDAPPMAVATGGSQLSGTAGRTDLLGPDRTDELTRLQFRSLRELAALPASVTILPTHGAGSFCGSGQADRERVTSVGRELDENPWLRPLGEDDFVRSMVAGFGAYPTYYRDMAPRNRVGPPILGGLPDAPALDPSAVRAALARGAVAVDARDRRRFAAGHLPGSWNIELSDTFASYVGWHLPFDAPLVLVLPEPAEAARREALEQLVRIGFDHVVGTMDGGVDAWVAAGGEVDVYETLRAAELRAETPSERGLVLDVRDREEWGAEPVLPGVVRIPHGELAQRLDELPAGAAITVACKSGARASIAASLLDAHDHPVRVVVSGGIPDLDQP
jgi:hydroxyacylglutathione hydrolase